MRAYLALLEDNPDRIARMRSSIIEVLPALQPVLFTNAFEMVDWFRKHLPDVSLISLDHDLPTRHADGTPIDCGDGRIVADFLARQPPTSPVIVHSSNADCAAGMYYALERAGWPVTRVVPFDDLEWIEGVWKTELLRLVQARWIKP